MNWSVKTMSPGLNSSLREPTVDEAKILVTPSFLNAHMLARLFTSVGRMVCLVPWRARNPTRLPANSPMVNGLDCTP
jgi:hypothetical protein